MAKGKKRNRNDGWTASDHNAQLEKKERRNAKMMGTKTTQQQQPTRNLHHASATTTTTATSTFTTKRMDRTSRLTHNTPEKRDAARLQLHITKVQREISELKQRLTNWDPVREAQRKDEQRKQQRAQQQEATNNDDDNAPKRRGRLGPESWKLRGAARPAWQVYDFDTRYVDPYAADHARAAAAQARSMNLLLLRPSHPITTTATTMDGDTSGSSTYLLHSVAPEEAREYLGLLMQLGHLAQEAKQYKTARAAFLECIELEGYDDNMSPGITASSPLSSSPPPTTSTMTCARESLMRMYMDLERYDAAYRFGERLPRDTSCVIRFTMAVVAMHLQKDDAIVTELLVQAVKSNIFATYYLCYYDIFQSAIEFTDDLADGDDEPQSTFEEALEYCSSPLVTLWKTTDGALAQLKALLSSSSSSGIFRTSDLEWDGRLSQIESQFHTRDRSGNERNSDDDDDDDDDHLDTTNGLDVPMFANMFRTAMEMAQESDLGTIG